MVLNRNCLDLLKRMTLKSSCINTAGISLHVNAHKTEYMCFNQAADISTLHVIN